MQRLIFIGCGGSGGQTLRFAMDQICADLKTRGADPRIPLSWQFIHIDAPVQEEDAGRGGFRAVTEYNEGSRRVGTYCSIGSQLTFENVVANRIGGLAKSAQQHQLLNNPALDLASWMPSTQKQLRELNGVNLADGAGEFRMMGRALFLNSLDKVVTAIRDADNRTKTAAANQDAIEIERLVPELGTTGSSEDERKTLILIVGSMAGGSGASMLLDVARAAAAAAPNSARVLYGFTPEIFKNLAIGITPGHMGNALAMAAEIAALQTETDSTANLLDQQLYKAMGLETSAKEPTFTRFFPIGLSQGTSATIKHEKADPATIYRRLGRGLARLVLSTKAFDTFTRYALGNSAGGAVVSTDQDLIGWGADTKAMGWAGFGYASLSMGRDRFREYAAQRLSGGAVQILTDGHLDPRAQNESGLVQLHRKVETNHPVFLQRIDIPATRQSAATPGSLPPDQLVVSWLDSRFGQRFKGDFDEALTSYRTMFPPAVMSDQVEEAQVWLQQAMSVCATLDPRQLAAELERRVKHHLREVVMKSQTEKILAATRDAISLYGLEYANELLVATRTGDLAEVSRILATLGEPAASPRALVPDLSRIAELLGSQQQHKYGRAKAVTDLGATVNREFTNILGATLGQFVFATFARILHSTYAEMIDDFFIPLENAIKDELKALNVQKAETKDSVGVELYYTDCYRKWPGVEIGSEDLVPPRFSTAHNEVLITETDTFPSVYKQLLAADQEEAASPEMAERRVQQLIISGVWKAIAGVESPETADDDSLRLIVATQEWRPDTLCDRSQDRWEEGSKGRFTLHAATGEVLDRALLYIDRKDQPFDTYISQDMRTYAADPAVSELEQQKRQQALANKFIETIGMAVPMVAVDKNITCSIHRDIDSIKQTVSFSPIPFANQPAGELVLNQISSDTTLSDTTRVSFERERETPSASVGVTRVDCFGTYQNFLPVAYSSLFANIHSYWAQSTANRDQFTSGRRTRSLRGFVPVSAAERKTMIAGWLLGRALGLVTVSSEQPARVAPRVFDMEESTWRAFPWPMYTPPERFSAPFYPDEWLPAVLESYALAWVGWYDHNYEILSAGQVDGNPLVAYRTLRRLIDKNPNEASQFPMPEGEKLLIEYLNTGGVGGQTALVGAQAATPEERLDALKANWTALAEYYRSLMAPDSPLQRVSRLDDVYSVPKCADIASEIVEACEQLIEAADRADARRTQGIAGPDGFPQANGIVR